MLTVKRVYEVPEPGDGTRFLVERLWPRGVKKEALRWKSWPGKRKRCMRKAYIPLFSVLISSQLFC